MSKKKKNGLGDEIILLEFLMCEVVKFLIRIIKSSVKLV